MTPPAGLALYIHVPYCLEKCGYCDFHSIAVGREELPWRSYAAALKCQLAFETASLELQNQTLSSIFFGGGTPSLLPPEFFREILESAAKYFSFDREIEITVETNPATAGTAHFSEWLRMGINRVSFGVQSFDDRSLMKLGRNHRAAEAGKAIRQALDAGFTNASADLIFGIEDQTLKMAEEDLKTALAFQLPHLSVYQLTVEPATPLFSWVQKGTFKIPAEEILEAMHLKIPAVLSAAGLERYEISNYARPGFESRHNLAYWRYRDYLGLGSGAVSFIKGRRRRTTRKLKNFLEGKWDFEDEETITPLIAQKEKWMMGLRLREGIFCEPDNVPWSDLLEGWRQKGAILVEAGNVRLTAEGFLWYNRIVQDFFAALDSKEAL